MPLTGSDLRRELAECVRLGVEQRARARVAAAAAAARGLEEPDVLFGRDLISREELR